MEPENLHARGFTVGWPHEFRTEPNTDIDEALDGLRRLFPSICIWYGHSTGSLWALLPDRLVEAKNATGLARQLHAALSRPRPVEGTGRGASASRPSVRRHDGTWSAPPIPVPSRQVVRPRHVDLLARLTAACGRRIRGTERRAHRPSGRGRATSVRPTSAGAG